MEDRDKGYKDLQELVKDLTSSDTYVAIGVLDGSGEVPDEGITVAGLATVHEFGAWAGPGHSVWIPERAPIRKTLDEQEDKINRATTRLLSNVVAGKENIDNALDKLGLFVSSQIRRTIQIGVTPENAPSTKAKKGSSKPLVDTGLLIRSYTHQVRHGK